MKESVYLTRTKPLSEFHFYSQLHLKLLSSYFQSEKGMIIHMIVLTDKKKKKGGMVSHLEK